MAFFDDRRFLLSHIRHSFITCDDTGMCEMVMLNEMMPNHLPDEPDSHLLDSLETVSKSELLDAAHSYDIVSDMDNYHRRRSNTAQRLDRLKKERKSQAKIRVIQWKDNPRQLSQTELEELFPRKELIPTRSKKEGMRSALSDQIEKYPAIPNNPFNEFARFDGRVNEGIPTKRIAIFLGMLLAQDKLTPMEVITLCNARVYDLIGLVCWQYTNEGREPKLKRNATNYALFIAEENGEVDSDFPNLNPREPVAKFDFPFLTLVEKDDDQADNLLVTVHLDEVFSKFQVPNANVPLQWIMEQALKRRKSDIDAGTTYRMEKLKEPNVGLNLQANLSDVDSREFRLISEEDDDPFEPAEDDGSKLPDMGSIEAPLYKLYVVNAVHNLGRAAEVQLGISGKKVDLTPTPQKGTSKLWSWHPKAVSYNVQCIADCELTQHKPNTGKASFKIVYHNGSDFQTQRFETDIKTAQDIIKKVHYIMQLCSSQVRNEYNTLKEKKQFRKSSSSSNYHIPGFS